jgi:vitamin B12 transporter
MERDAARPTRRSSTTTLLLSRSVWALSILLFSATAAIAQAPVTVTGVVRDTSGGVLVDVTVEARVGDRVVASTTTDGQGAYRLSAPARTPFAIRTHRPGFADRIDALEAAAGDVSHDVALHIGTMSDTLVVTAARVLEDRTSVTQAMSVLTRDDVEALGATELAEVLRFVPGASVEGTGREGGGPTGLFVRGGDSDYNVVLIDGVRVNLDGGRFDFGRVAAGEIDRVEVLRGAQSSLWGADAMTSVVQVFTRRARAADRPDASGFVEAGSFDTYRGGAGVNGGATTRIDYRAAINVRHTGGAFSDLLPEDDRYRQTALDGGLGVALGSSASVRAGLRYSRADGRAVGPITFGARDTGTAYDTRDLSLYGTVSHTLGARVTGSGTVNYFRFRGRSADRIDDAPFPTYAILTGTPDARYPRGPRLVRLIDATEFAALSAAGGLPAPGQFLAAAESFDFPTDPFSEIMRFRRSSARYQADYGWRSGHRSSVGYDWERETNPDVDGFDLDNHAVFAQHQSTFADRWFVTVGARVDRKERYDTYVSPKLSAGGFLMSHRRGAVSSVKIFGNLGRGVKSPTFSERFGSPFADGNPAITVEQSKSGDLGVETTFADQRIRATAIYFRNDFTDQISYRFGPIGDGIPEFVNVDGSKASGLELELALQRPARGFTVTGTYAFVDSEVVTNQSGSPQFQPGQPLLRRPRHSGSVRAAYSRGRATITGSLRLIGDRFDNSFLFMSTVPNAERPTSVLTDITINPGYVVAGLGLDVKVQDALSIFVRGDNIGDTTYESALGYPGLPRAIVAGARFRLGVGR